MRVLYYNWVDYLDDENRGGGVSVYQRNIMEQASNDPEISCVFLSSGISYDLLSRKPRWEQVKHGPKKDRHVRFEIVNSGVLSPAHHSFGDARQISDPATESVFFDFLETHGPFDVVHFNNLEGVPSDVLRLKSKFPKTKVFLSLHNYYPICPQVNLWFKESENCQDFDQGRKCGVCLMHKHDPQIVELANSIAFTLKKMRIRPRTRQFDYGFKAAIRITGSLLRVYKSTYGDRFRKLLRWRTAKREALPTLQKLKPNHIGFYNRRAAMIKQINLYCDRVLCVSDRVGSIAIRSGISAHLVHTQYIGTRHAANFEKTKPRRAPKLRNGKLKVAYLGYMRKDKGFFFLLEALERVPDESASNIDLVFACQIRCASTLERIRELSGKFSSVYWADGFKDNQLDEILRNVDVGVIPVLWEDNLPQVAIEMHSRHIPLITSDLGGARELGNTPMLVFKAGDHGSFRKLIDRLLIEDDWADKYWKNAMPPINLHTHLQELKDLYSEPVSHRVEVVEAPKSASCTIRLNQVDTPQRLH